MALVASFMLLSGCGIGEGETSEHPDSETDKEPQVIVVGKDSLPYTQSTIYNQLFDINNRVEIDIDIDEKQIAQIQEDYDKYAQMGSKSPIYREAALNITITTNESSYMYHIPNVGVRMKGNTSRTSFYNEREGQYNLIHLRVQFMDGDFATLESLELKWNRNDDMTYVREIYAYDIYRDMGVLAPHVTLASTDFGDVHQGVFYVYEPVDKNFIEKYVDKDNQEGDLYKCAWTRNGASLTMECSVGIENEDEVKFYNYDLKTNKKSSEHKQMNNLLKVLNKSNVTKEELENVVDIDNFLAFAAVSYFVGSPDDIRNNYNNHYIYFLKSSGKAIFIPYDCDRVLGVTYGWNPTGNGMTEVSPFSTRAEGAGSEQQNPLFRLTVDKGGYYITEYTQKLNLVAESKWLTTDQFNKYYNAASSNYAEDTKPDKTFYNAEHHHFTFDVNASKGLGSSKGNASFAEYVEAILRTYQKYE